MPDPETTYLTQKAVLWSANGYDNDGEPKVNAGEEIDVRWEWDEKDTNDPNARKVNRVATVRVDREIEVGSWMWLGELDKYAATKEKYEVLAYKEVPDVKGRKFSRVVTLGRASAELPTLA